MYYPATLPLRHPVRAFLILIALVSAITPISASIIATGDFTPTSPADLYPTGGDSGRNGNIGNSSDGSLLIDGGSLLNVRDLYFGRQLGVTGTGMVTGSDPDSALASEINAGRDLYIGDGGHGIISVSNSGKITVGSNLYMGNQGTGEGSLLVDGDGSLLTVMNALYLGESGSGSLMIQNGGQAIVAKTVSLGENSGSSGMLKVQGSGSYFSAQDLFVGRRSYGSLLVGEGAVVAVGIDLSVRNAGEIAVDGTGSLLTVADDFKIDHGTLTLSNEAQLHTHLAIVGNAVTGIGEAHVRGPGTQWTNTGNLTIGGAGQGVINLQDGAIIDAMGSTLIGSAGAGNGALTVHGENSVWKSGINVRVGNDTGASGQLNLVNGGRLESQWEVRINSTGTANLFVDGDGVIKAGISAPTQDTGDYINGGVTNLFAPAELAAGEYEPIQVGEDSGLHNDGVINAIGGTFDSDTRVFTVSEVTTDTTGVLGGKRIQFDEGLIVSFADSVGEITFNVEKIAPEFIFGEEVLAAYEFDTERDGVPTGLSFMLGEEWEWDELSFWYLADGETDWALFDSALTQAEGNYASLLTTHFSSYAITVAVPEPTSLALVGIGLLCVGSHRRRRRSVR